MKGMQTEKKTDESSIDVKNSIDILLETSCVTASRSSCSTPSWRSRFLARNLCVSRWAWPLIDKNCVQWAVNVRRVNDEWPTAAQPVSNKLSIQVIISKHDLFLFHRFHHRLFGVFVTCLVSVIISSYRLRPLSFTDKWQICVVNDWWKSQGVALLSPTSVQQSTTSTSAEGKHLEHVWESGCSCDVFSGWVPTFLRGFTRW